MGKKLLMNKFENNVIESWDYEWYATEGKLPASNDSNSISNVELVYNEDYLQITIKNSTSYIRFYPPSKTSTNAIIETLISANRLFNVGNGIRVQLSNGVFGIQIKISSYNDSKLKLERLYGTNPNNRKFIQYIDEKIFYKIKLVLEGNIAKIYINDELVDSSNKSLSGTENDVSYAEGNSTSLNSILFQNSPTLGCIKYIKFKEF